jgi:hypothetical protein
MKDMRADTLRPRRLRFHQRKKPVEKMVQWDQI